MYLRVGVASDRGRVRLTNEDSYLVSPGLYAVCDGMGGALGGEVASQMACEALRSLDVSGADEEELRRAIAEANQAIVSRSLSEAQLAGMGTTLTVAVAREGEFLIGHVGDSRAYLLHSDQLLQLSADHSWVAEMLRRGEITEAEAAVHPHRSVITRALGTDTTVEPDLFVVPFATGDRLLLCTDGLSGMVSADDIAAVLRQPEDPQAIAEQLVKAAIAAGGEDNVTVIVIEAGSEGAARGEERSAEGSAAAGGLSGTGSPEDAGGPGRVIIGPTDRGETRASTPAAASGRPLPAWQRLRGSFSGKEVKEKARPRGRRAGLTKRRVLVLAVVVVVLAALLGGFVAFNSTVYYVGTYEGMVALYQGLPGEVLGVELSSVVEIGEVAYDSLAPYLKERVDAHDLLSKEEGRAFLRTLGTLK